MNVRLMIIRLMIVRLMNVRSFNDSSGHPQSDRHHTQVVQVVWDPKVVSFADILRQFWQSHDPTQGNGQGNDRGTQYRSGMFG